MITSMKTSKILGYSFIVLFAGTVMAAETYKIMVHQKITNELGAVVEVRLQVEADRDGCKYRASETITNAAVIADMQTNSATVKAHCEVLAAKASKFIDGMTCKCLDLTSVTSTNIVIDPAEVATQKAALP